MTPGPTRRRPALLRLAVPTTIVLTLLNAVLPAAATGSNRPRPQAVGAALVAVGHGAFTLGKRPLPYLHGINYEGHADRPWRMWQDGLFSPTLIARDFDAIAAAGYNPVRIFVQSPLPQMILAGDYTRLDTVVALAAQRGLRLLITLNDDGDPDLRRVARVDGLLAAHLAGNPAIFGYDLRNEPNLVDIAASIYPPGAPLPLLSRALISAYRERVSMASAARARRSGSWSGGGFAAFDTRKLYYYLNARAVLNDFLSHNPGYPTVPATPYWRRFVDLANRTLGSYLYAQLAALHAADRTHLTTVGYRSGFWSALPANSALDFRSIHIYPPADFDGFHATLRYFEALNALAPSPLILEEYGVSNDRTDTQSSAIRELATSLYLRALGGAGDLKWMFSDDAVGYNHYENNLGAVNAQDRPKPTYLASAAADAYWARTAQPAGLILQADPVSGAGFVLAARNGLALGGSLPYADARVSYTPRGPGILWLDWSTPGILRITPTTGGTLTLRLGALTGATALLSLATSLPAEPTITPTVPASPTAVGVLVPTAAATPGATSPQLATMPATATASISPTIAPPAPINTPASAAPLAATGSLTVTLALQAGVTETLSYRAAGAPPPVPVDLPAPALSAGWYVIARGHNVAPPFLGPWLALGSAMVGLPLTEQFAYHGLPTQYFDDVALRIGPRGLTTAPIGVVALGGAARPRAKELPKRIPHVYDRATGHNIRGFFLDYWRRYGGLRFWGDPLTEEIRERGRLVQYFSGAEFTLARTHGARVDVALLPLGRRMWPAIRSVYGL